MPRGLVISDLHIFSAVSTWKAHIDAIERLIDTSSTVVLNGDIFDFKRSILPSTAATTHAAIEWLLTFIKNHPSVTFHYVIGNHDAVTIFMQALNNLAAEVSNLQVHYSHVILGTNLFLHGDVCHSNMDSVALERSRQMYAKIEPNQVSIALSRLIVSLGANRIAYLTHPKEKLCGHIVYFLRKVVAAELDHVQSVFFGHTHVAFEDFPYEGKRFWNTGGTISNLSFKALTFEE